MGKKHAGKDGHGETLIGVGTVLEGTFDIEYDVRVDGTMRGKRLATRGRDHKARLPIHYASAFGHLEMVRLLLEAFIEEGEEGLVDAADAHAEDLGRMWCDQQEFVDAVAHGWVIGVGRVEACEIRESLRGQRVEIPWR